MVMDATHARLAIVGLLLGTGLLTACSVTATSADIPGELSEGTWGGDTSRVIVTANQVHVHIRCTLGDFAGPIDLDANGEFTVAGTYVLRAFPVNLDPELPAQFTGRVAGNRLTLVVAVNDTVEQRLVALGPVTMTLGQSTPMGNCPVCAVPPPLDSVPES
jgi:hypothetical protein